MVLDIGDIIVVFSVLAPDIIVHAFFLASCDWSFYSI